MTGQFFEPRVYLGGRLFSTEEFDGVAGSSVEEKITNLKIAAGSSISAFGIGASLSGEFNTGNDKKDQTKVSSMSRSISWSADGGDTTLCNKYEPITSPLPGPGGVLTIACQFRG